MNIEHMYAFSMMQWLRIDTKTRPEVCRIFKKYTEAAMPSASDSTSNVIWFSK